MAIIKLTGAHTNIKGKVVCFDKDLYFETTSCNFKKDVIEDVDGEIIECSIFNGVIVKETPEEILALIKEAENAQL